MTDTVNYTCIGNYRGLRHIVMKRFLLSALLSLALSAPALAATDFLQATGTNGCIASKLTFQSSELNALGSGSAVVSSVGGSSGVFSQSNTGSAPFGDIWFTSGGSTTAAAAGGYIAGWYLESSDGGTSFEQVTTATTTQAPIARAPDFIIPVLPIAMTSASIYYAQGRNPFLPFTSYKVELWNMTGEALASTGNTLVVCPEAMQY